MSKLTFSQKDIKILNRNPNVLRVSSKLITYSDDFKKYFVEQYLRGKLPRIIFEESGLDIDMFGLNLIKKLL